MRAVLGVSFIVEGYSLMMATRAVLQGATAAKLGFWEYLQRGLDPTSVAVMLEDGAAVTGLVVAGTLPVLCTLPRVCSIDSSALQQGLNPTSVAVMLEDGAAVTGLVVAGTLCMLGMLPEAHQTPHPTPPKLGL